MNYERRKIFESIADIDEKYVAEARTKAAQKKQPMWVKWGAMAACLCLVIASVIMIPRLGGSGTSHGDYPATIMVNGTNYYSTNNAVTVEVDASAIQYTTSYAENGVPKKGGEANFNRDTGTPYAVLEDGMVVVMIDNEWIEFKAK